MIIYGPVHNDSNFFDRPRLKVSSYSKTLSPTLNCVSLTFLSYCLFFRLYFFFLDIFSSDLVRSSNFPVILARSLHNYKSVSAVALAQ